MLHIIASVDPRHGGPIEGIRASNAALSARGCDREIVSLDAPDDPWLRDCPLPATGVGLSGPLYGRLRGAVPWLRYGYTPHLAPWLDANLPRFDLAIVNGLWNFCALGSLGALRRRGIPYYVFTHGMLDPWFRRTYPVKTLAKQVSWWLAEGPLLAGARAVLFTSEEERALARDAFHPYRCRERVVGYGTADVMGDAKRQAAVFRAGLPALGERPFLLFLGRIHEKKGCDLLVRAFARAAAGHPDLDLVVAGPDPQRWTPRLRTIASELGVAARIHWPGMLLGDLKWGAFHACEAFVLPSHQENFGIAVAEAMACGRPVIVTNKVNIWREVEEAGGIVCDDDQAGVDGALARFLALDQAERRRRGAAARAGFVRHFRMEEAASRLVAMMRADLAADAGPPP